MQTSSTHTDTQTTTLRKLRTFLNAAMEQAESETPAICGRIRSAREQLKDQWDADNPGERGNPFTQENVAHRMGLTRDGYRPFEINREPKLRRRREIAEALGLPPDHFETNEEVADATARIAAEAERFREMGDQFEEMIAVLRSHLATLPQLDQGEGHAQVRSGQE